MNIIFICYWGIHEPLSVSTVYPHLEFLESSDKIKKVFLISFERSSFHSFNLFKKIEHFPIVEKASPPILNKLLSFKNAWLEVKEIVSKNLIELIIARSSLSGILAYHAKKKYDIKFVVESFEPHANYMIDSNVWKKWGFKYYILNRYETIIKKTAYKLFPVANNYKKKLISEKISHEKIDVLPCPININNFEFNVGKRNIKRNELNIDEKTVVAIYVGKFGGIYLKEEAIDIFSKTLSDFNKWHLIILTPEDPKIIYSLAINYGISKTQIYVAKVRPSEVASYLSASDFAFATYRTTLSSSYLCPIKIGEYYASGLPIVITENIGDDSTIIAKNKIGIVVNTDNAINKVSELKQILNNPNHRNRIRDIAIRHRSININKRCYTKLGLI